MKAKKILASLLASSLVLSSAAMVAFAEGEDAVAQIGDKKYATLVEAVANVGSGETIKLLKDATGSGIKVTEGHNFTIDFGGNTYTVVNPTVGSTGTETNAMQLLKGSTLTFKNGTIKAGTTAAQILIQKYCDLTLEDMNLEGGSNTSYVLSNNNATTTVKGNTNITSVNGKYAFDSCYWPSSYPSVHVVFDESMTGTVTGKVEYGYYGTDASANVPANHTITIKGGTFTEDVQPYVANGYSETVSGDRYTVAKTTTMPKITSGTVKTAVVNNKYDQITVNTDSLENKYDNTSGKTVINYYVNNGTDKMPVRAEYNGFIEGDVVYGLIVTGVPEGKTITITVE